MVLWLASTGAGIITLLACLQISAFNRSFAYVFWASVWAECPCAGRYLFGKIGQLTAGFCPKPLKNYAFAKRHCTTLVICCYRTLIVILLLIESCRNFPPYPCPSPMVPPTRHSNPSGQVLRWSAAVRSIFSNPGMPSGPPPRPSHLPTENEDVSHGSQSRRWRLPRVATVQGEHRQPAAGVSLSFCITMQLSRIK